MSARVYVECCARTVPVNESWRYWTGSSSGWVRLCCEGYGCRKETTI